MASGYRGFWRLNRRKNKAARSRRKRASLHLGHEPLEGKRLLAFSALPASGSLGGLPLVLSSDSAHSSHELTIILDDQTNSAAGFVTATITTFDGTTTQTGQYFNFSDITYTASNDTTGLVSNKVSLWTSYEADLAGYETSPASDADVGLSTNWQINNHFSTKFSPTSPVLVELFNADALTVTSGVLGGGSSTIAGEFESPTLSPNLNAATGASITLISGTSIADSAASAPDPIVAYTLTLESQTGNVNLSADVFTVGDLSVKAAGSATVGDLFESKAGDISIQSTSGGVYIAGNAKVHAMAGGINLSALRGDVAAANLFAETDIVIQALGDVSLDQVIQSVAGNVVVTSDRTVNVAATIQAGEDIRISAGLGVTSISGGCVRVDVTSGGSNYEYAIVTIAPPASGQGRAATAQAVIAGGVITAIQIVDPGYGYAPDERAAVTITGSPSRTTQNVVLIGSPPTPVITTTVIPAGSGAVAVAVASNAISTLSAGDEVVVSAVHDMNLDMLIDGSSVSLTSDCGTIDVKQICSEGDVDVDGSQGVAILEEARSEGGGVTIVAAAGPVDVVDLYAGEDIQVTAAQAISIKGLLQADAGDIAVTSTSGNLSMINAAKLHAVQGSVSLLAKRGASALQNVFAAQNITLDSLGDVALTEKVHAASGDVAIVSNGGIDNSGYVEAGGALSLTASQAITSLGGGIARLDLLSGGSNYEYAIVTVAGPSSGGGQAATARATVTNGVITAITIIDPGYGYAPGESVKVTIEGQTAGTGAGAGGVQRPTAAGARAQAFAAQSSSLLFAGDDITLRGGTLVEVTNQIQSKAGAVEVDVLAGPLKLSQVFAEADIDLLAAQSISLGGLLRTATGNVEIQSTGGGLDMKGTVLAPAGGVEITTAGQIVQRGGSVSRDKIFLLSRGRDYTYALVVVSPPPGAGEQALARAVIVDPDPFDDDDGGYISEIILLDPGWGYPSDSRIEVNIQGDGEGAAAVFGTDLISSSIDAKNDVVIRSADAITLVSTVRSATGDIDILTTLGGVSIESLTAGGSINVTSNRGEVTLVSLSANDDIGVNADQGLSITDSLNTLDGSVTLETTNGDITFVKKLNFGDNYLVDDAATVIEAETVVSSKAGAISMTAHNGSIVSPYVINAALDVNLSSLLGTELTNQITSQEGDINVESTSSLVRVRSNMVAEEGSITIKAQTALLQEFASGISKIELLSPGPMQRVPPAVTVTIAPPKNGGAAATAFAVIERRTVDDDNNDANDGAGDFNNVIEYEYFIGSIAIIDPGFGYEVGENPLVTITGVDGATARAYGPTMVAMLTAQKNIDLLAGENMRLLTKVHAVDGDVTIASNAGDIDLTAKSLFVSSKAGGIAIDAHGGAVDLERATAFGDVAVNAKERIDVLRSVMSENGSIQIASTNNAVNVRQLNAKQNVAVSGFKTSIGVGEIVGVEGDVFLASTAGGLRINANIVAGADVTLQAQTFIQQLDRTALEAVEILAEGSDRQVTLTPVPPNVGVVIAAPAAGGRAATALAIVERRFLGNDPGGNEPLYEFYVDRIEIIDAGVGYAIGESPVVTITGIRGALARGIGPTNMRNISSSEGVVLEAGDDITLLNTVTVADGDIVITTASGDVDLSAKTVTLSAKNGSVDISTFTGAILSPPTLNVTNNISLQSSAALTLTNELTALTGDVTLRSTSGGVSLANNVFAGERITLDANAGILQTKGFVQAQELVVGNKSALPVILGAQENNIDRFAGKSVGGITYVDADSFETGVLRGGKLGDQRVEVSTNGALTLQAGTSSSGPLRIVGGVSAAPNQFFLSSGSAAIPGNVEYVVTSSVSNGPLSFTGTLANMLRFANLNRARFDGAVVPQTIVFDADGYAVQTITVNTTLPNVTQPVTIDGSETESSVAIERVEITRGTNAVNGLTFAAGSAGSEVTGLSVTGFTGGAGISLLSGGTTVTDTFVGVQRDGSTIKANLVGIDISGMNAMGNIVGGSEEDDANVIGGNTFGIRVRNRASENLIAGNFIGTTTAGTKVGNTVGVLITGATSTLVSDNVISNNTDGVWLNAAKAMVATANRIEANTIVGNSAGAGVRVTASSFAIVGGVDAGNVIGENGVGVVISGGSISNTVASNYIGTDADGTDLGNGSDGVQIVASIGNTIGGSTKDDGNTVANNGGSGIVIRNSLAKSTAFGNKVFANLSTSNGVHGILVEGGAFHAIGTGEDTGNTVILNAVDGIRVQSFGRTASTQNLIRGNLVGTDTRIADIDLGNFGDGIQILGGSANRIDLGNVVRFNKENGVRVRGSSSNFIGSDIVGEGNEIRDNDENGVVIDGGDAQNLLARDNVVAGNLIDRNGWSPTSTTPGNGVLVSGSRTVNAAIGMRLVNGRLVGLGNEILDNAGYGVSVVGGASNVQIQGNAIAENALGPVHVAASANANVATPVIESALLHRLKGTAAQMVVTGTVTGPIGQQLAIDIYSTPAVNVTPGTPDYGRRHIGRLTVTITNVTGTKFSATLAIDGAATGDLITATATTMSAVAGSGMVATPIGSTSRFSAARMLTLSPAISSTSPTSQARRV